MNVVYNHELHQRIKKNATRLCDDIYSYPDVFTRGSSWPGDHEGRALLGLCSIYVALNGYQKEQEEILRHARDIFNHLEEYTNSHFYFGDEFDGSVVDEQQLSGNSWYLRALVEFYKITKDPKVITYIHEIIDNYLIPISPFYSRYSTKVREMGGVGGHIVTSAEDGWKYSSDIGCAFIMLDGMTAAYELCPSDKLKRIIEERIEQFINLDYLNLEFQTHATLSCTRGILRFYHLTNDEKYLKHAIQIFDCYLKNGRTLDYGNFNWFKREDTWTEPCAIVDSFIVSKYLYQYTREIEYVRIANRIYLNAFRGMQRSNGGAGCNTCLRPQEKVMRLWLYEAWFCCTMRLAEGLKEVASFTYEDEESVFIPILHEGTYVLEDGGKIEISGDIYNNQKVCMTTFNCHKEIKFYLHEDIVIDNIKREDPILAIIPSGDKIVIDSKISVHQEGECNFAGDLLLVKKVNDYQEAFFVIDGNDYGRVVNFMLVLNEKEAEEIRQEL